VRLPNWEGRADEQHVGSPVRPGPRVLHSRRQRYRNRERSLAISIELNEISDVAVKQNVEIVIRDCIGDRPKEEDWKV
jgi:hypothetical protein